MSQQRPLPPPSSLNFQDILYVLFKHKWKIVLIAAIAAAAAANVYIRTQPLYASEAKLMVRYVVDRSAVDPLDPQPKTPGAFGGDSLTNAEMEILTSWDLAEQVAEAVGVERLAPGGDKAAAAHSILSGLTAAVPKVNNNVIIVSYKNADPVLAKRVLEELVSRYFVKHLEVHRSVDAFNFVTQQTDQVRERLNQTEEVLKRLKDTVGISSLAEATDSLTKERLKIRDALEGAEAEQTEQKARIAEMKESAPTTATNSSDAIPPEKQPSVTEIQQYQTLVERLDKLRDREIDLLASYIPEDRQPVPAVQTESPGTAPRIRVRSINSESGITYSGGDREKARQLARERYISQNNTGFAYRMGKKDYDTLVKEAEQDILVQKSTQSQEAKASKNVLVQLNRTQIENLEKQRLELEKKYPSIASLALAASTPVAATTFQNHELGLLAERVRLAGIEARIQTLKPRLLDVQKRIEKLSEIGPQIAQLERAKEIEENNYKYFQASLEKARIDEALDPSKMPNISAIQKPSPAVTAKSGVRKKGLALAGGIFGFGVALIFFMELVVNRTVKRAAELDTLLGIPFLLSIPYFGRRPKHPPLLHSINGQKLLTSPPGDLPADAPPWKCEHFIRPFCEAIRDRLVLYFELHGLNHKPKLVAVTGFSHGAGSSTISAGLASALSETGDGKVLLVDMNVGRPEVHPFFRGAPECSLAEALVGSPAPAGENLYLAVATPRDAWQDQLIPKKFYNLMPHLKASEFDYIIFDMPPLSQTSITPPMAGLMDKVLTIVEAEKSDRDFLKRTYAELLACRANVAVIFNKARSYIPRWLAVEG
jgi:uncharacterized protein involved in exopolysaccharide biosynthesis/Mrp family chromosome partitioning ATPase